MKNYYDVLEVSRKASKDTINKVFKMHMKANHPDLFQGEEKAKAEEKSKELTEAYNVLSDDVQRAKYDEELKSQETTVSAVQLQSILEENEYLKKLLAQKNDYIDKLTAQDDFNDSSATYNQQSYNNYYGVNNTQSQFERGTGFNGFTPPTAQNPYANMSAEDLRNIQKAQTTEYYKQLFKEAGIKIILFIILLIVILISMSSTFKDLQSLFE